MVSMKFLRDEDGSFSIEAALWLPIFTLVTALLIDISSLYHDKAAILSVVREANRAYATGSFTTESQVVTHVTDTVRHLSPNATVSATFDGAYLTTQVSVPSRDLMQMKILSQFNTIDVAVGLRQLREW